MRVLLAFLANTAANFIIGLLIAKFLGPEEYGRFAIAFSITLVVQAALFDWLRLSAQRFYSERVRDGAPMVRATLDACFLAVTFGLAAATALFAAIGPQLDFDGDLILLALVAATMNGLFDYSTALVRARFRDALFGRLVIVKNILALVLMGGGAFLFHSAGVALAAVSASLFGTVALAGRALRDPGAHLAAARRDTARTLIAYSAPIVASHLLYQAIPLASRSVAASVYGFADTGQLALAYDLGMRGVQALGMALDVLLFQIAVAAHEEHGAARAKAQVGRNMGVVIAFLMPACAGIYLVMPSIEALIVPHEFRGPFGHYLALLLPGLFAMAVCLFAINPLFQIEKKTAPLIGAALVAAVSGAVLALVLPFGADPSNLALAQCGAYIAALAATLVFALRAEPIWPRLSDLFAASVATGMMAAALWPLRDMTPGFFTLLFQIVVGAGVYGALTLAFDIVGLRGVAFACLPPALVRLRARAAAAAQKTRS